MPKVNASLVVRPHRPWRLWLLLALLPLLLAAVARGALEYGREQAALDFSVLEARNEGLQKRLGELEAENRGLRERTVVLERTAQVDRRAHDEVRADLDALQGEIAELTEELAFYRGIVSPGEVEPGLRVQELLLTPGGDRFYRYRLVLTQVLNHDRRAEGRVALRVEGFEGGEAARYPFEELGGGDNPRFGFKYFQNIEGDIRLPAGFSPTRVVVDVKPSGKGKKKRRPKPFSRAFDWPSEAASRLTGGESVGG